MDGASLLYRLQVLKMGGLHLPVSEQRRFHIMMKKVCLTATPCGLCPMPMLWRQVVCPFVSTNVPT